MQPFSPRALLALFALGLVLGACAGLGLTPEQAAPVVAKTLEGFAAAFVAALAAAGITDAETVGRLVAELEPVVRRALEGALTTGPDWRGILGDAADIGFGLLLGWLGIRRDSPLRAGVAKLLGKKPAVAGAGA